MRLIVLLSLLLSLVTAGTPAALAQDRQPTLDTLVRHTNTAVPLVEGPQDVTIVKFVAQILQRQHYLRPPINDEASSKFLDRYLDSLDNLHIYFIQSDLQEFEKYR